MTHNANCFKNAPHPLTGGWGGWWEIPMLSQREVLFTTLTPKSQTRTVPWQ